MAIIITREEIKEQYAEWGIYFIDDIEESMDRELTDEECRKILMHCLGYAPSGRELAEEALGMKLPRRRGLQQQKYYKTC